MFLFMMFKDVSEKNERDMPIKTIPFNYNYQLP